MRTRLILFIILCLIISQYTYAEIIVSDNVLIDMNFRYRIEADGRDFNSTTGMYDYHLLRSQLGVKIRPADNFLARFKFKESRYLGTTGSNQPSSASVEFQEAYVQPENILGQPLALQLGRFEISYGRRRILGNGNWSNFGPRTYDGARFIFTPKPKTRWDLFYATIVERSNKDQRPYTDEEFYKNDRQLVGVHGTLADGNFQPTLLLDWDPGAPLSNDIYPYTIEMKSEYLLTFALFGRKTIGNLLTELDFAWQFGEKNSIRSGYYGNRDVKSGILAFDAWYTFSHSRHKPYVGLGTDIQTGVGLDSRDDGNFYTPFMSKHRFKGTMDLYKGELPQGLVDLIFHCGVKPSKRFRLDTDYHFFRSFKAYRETEDKSFFNYGQEIDFRFRSQLTDYLNLDTNVCGFWPHKDWKEKQDPAYFFQLSLISIF